MSKRINWRDKAINDLQQEMGMNQSDAISYFDKAYKQALKLAKGVRGGLNVQREVYASIFYDYKNVFQIDANNNIQLNTAFQGSLNLEKTRTLERMSGFLEDYGDQRVVQSIFEEYLSGRMSKKEFNSYIKAFKKVSTKYLTSGS